MRKEQKMRVSISALKTGRLLPGAALLLSILFLTGQTLNCCRVNEAFGHSLRALFHGATGYQGEAIAAHEGIGEDAHPHCHGHPSDESGIHSVPQDLAGESHWVQDGSCLSEKSIAGKPMLANEFSGLQLEIPVFARICETRMPLPVCFQRPRPQNKSSPPLYLTTLQILV